MQTYGSQVWDASFAIQALLATNLSDEIGPTLMKGHDFLKKSQVFLIYIHQLRSRSVKASNL
jgi:beta-amyrin synthase